MNKCSRSSSAGYLMEVSLCDLSQVDVPDATKTLSVQGVVLVQICLRHRLLNQQLPHQW